MAAAELQRPVPQSLNRALLTLGATPHQLLVCTRGIEAANNIIALPHPLARATSQQAQGRWRGSRDYCNPTRSCDSHFLHYYLI